MDRLISAMTVKSVNYSRLSSSTPRHLHRTRAFTLIEIVVVLIVLGIITGMATVTYYSLELNAYNHSAELTTSTTASEAETYYTNQNQFPQSSDLSSVEPSYTFIDGSSPSGLSQSATEVSVFTHTIQGSEVETFTTLSNSGNCYEETIWPPDNPTQNSYVVLPSSSCYASNASDTTEATQW